MNHRDKLVIKVMLQLLQRMDQCNEEILYHSMAQLVQGLLMTELRFAFSYCDREEWAMCVKGKLDTNKWSITDKGKAALLEM